jgi:hypothetical protein
MEVYSIRS